MSDANDVTGYQGGDDASGKGGRARQRAIDSAVNGAQSPGNQSANSPSVPVKQHPAAYRPSAAEKASRSYGAPVDSAPILSGGGD